jgi:antitoxin (DNA-binding transcriptional repressor) of toxin-antitoxin stability system
MTTVTIEEAQAKLPELIENLVAGEQVLITRDRRPVLGEEKQRRLPRKAGNCKGMVKIVDDDDEHLKDFAEYMK